MGKIRCPKWAFDLTIKFCSITRTVLLSEPHFLKCSLSLLRSTFSISLMSTTCSSRCRANEEHASRDSAIDIEDFIRLYYGEVGVDDFIGLYNGRQDLKRVASRLTSATDIGTQTRSSSFDVAPKLASQARNRAMTYQEDDVSPIAVSCL